MKSNNNITSYLITTSTTRHHFFSVMTPAVYLLVIRVVKIEHVYKEFFAGIAPTNIYIFVAWNMFEEYTARTVY